ncbi:acyl-CoA dehydrogenase family protein [Mycetocola reblochoni]|uniref:acyl-CoA dehydrogenase family protein n=1 Tax=Mycetocola reblochoni TaxID=331618 RepID=UPI003F9C1E5F
MTSDVLSDALLARIRSRAPGHDRANTFPHDDLAELAAAGYLRAFVPADRGGLGWTLSEVSRAQSRLAAAAPATALAVNMHLVWTGVARLLNDRGDTGLDAVLDDAAAGEIFAFGVSEAGNDLVLFGSDTVAEPDGDGGYRFTGTKIFTSLAPAWTRLGVTGQDSSEPGAPHIVYALLHRDDATITSPEDWDTVGMRATQSRTTRLTGAHAPRGQVLRRIPAGPNADPIVFGIFAMFELLIASVYTGIAERALELGVEAASTRISKRTGRPLSADPDIRHRLAGAAIALGGVRPQLDALTAEVTSGADHGASWFPRLVGLKVTATETARDVVDAAIRSAGGSSYASSAELGRLYRDVLAGIFHPSDDESAHATVASWLLGPVDDQP